MQTESGQQDQGHAFIRAMSGVLWGSRAKAGFARSHQKDQVLASSIGVLSEGCTGKELGGRKDCLSPGALGKLYQELTLVILQALV